MLLCTSLIVGLIQFCYRVPLHVSIIIMEMTYVITNMLPEAVSVLLVNVVYRGDVTNVIDGIVILKWEAYVLTILGRAICLAVTYGLFRKFRYQLQRKDAFVLTVGFLLVFSVYFVSTYGYLNLHWEDTLLLDLATSALGVYFIVQLLYTKNVSWLREQEQKDKMQIAQMSRQFEYYREKLKDEEKVRALYHDMKNHLLILQRQMNSPEAARMVEDLESQVAMYENYAHTGNDFLDIILRDKAEKAREKQIELSVSVNFSGMDFMEPLDISTIFGNGLDNAIEASEKLPGEHRAILVKGGRVQDFLSVLMENNCLQESGDKKSRTHGEDDFLHGFGISNMKRAAEKYGGQLTTRCENGRFILKILIPIP